MHMPAESELCAFEAFRRSCCCRTRDWGVFYLYLWFLEMPREGGARRKVQAMVIGLGAASETRNTRKWDDEVHTNPQGTQRSRYPRMTLKIGAQAASRVPVSPAAAVVVFARPFHVGPLGKQSSWLHLGMEASQTWKWAQRPG